MIRTANAQDQRTGENVSRTNVDDTDHVTGETDTLGYSYDPAQADALTGVTVKSDIWKLPGISKIAPRELSAFVHSFCDWPRCWNGVRARGIVPKLFTN
jgi:hypothetical protein